MIISENQNDQNNIVLKYKDNTLTRVTFYEYLGSMMTDDGKIDVGITAKCSTY